MLQTLSPFHNSYSRVLASDPWQCPLVSLPSADTYSSIYSGFINHQTAAALHISCI